jgi:hypothetical protein
MFPKQGQFIHPKTVDNDVEETIPSIFETRKKLFSKETEGCTKNEHIWNSSVISNEFFHNQLRPVLTVMRVFGVLPIKLPTEGKYRLYKQLLLHFKTFQQMATLRAVPNAFRAPEIPCGF